MPPHVARSSRVQYRADLEWPCFVVEGSDGFAFCTADEGTALVARYVQFGSLDDDERKITVYRIVGAFLPKVPGRDEMGRLPHKHAGAAEAARIADSGIDLLCGM